MLGVAEAGAGAQAVEVEVEVAQASSGGPPAAAAAESASDGPCGWTRLWQLGSMLRLRVEGRAPCSPA